jgi:hypothetical protein
MYKRQTSGELAVSLENQFTPHYLCDENHEWQVEARAQVLLDAIANNPPPPENKTM